jgi:glutamine cyclotransferase
MKTLVIVALLALGLVFWLIRPPVRRAQKESGARDQAPVMGGAALAGTSGAPATGGKRGRASGGPAPPAARLAAKVLSTRPHDPSAYTQGLVWHRGALYESDGLYGSSSLRQVDPVTGEVRRRVNLPDGFFAEGLAAVGGRLIQLTWREGVAFVYSLAAFERAGEFHYQGEGWGLCYDGRRLIMSDGSDRLSFRDPKSFALQGEVQVLLDGRPVHELNELECVEGAVYANVWMTDDILRIDPQTGRVDAVIDASGLLTAEEMAHAEVLNGIAYLPETKTFLITGKLWPKMFEVVWVPK